MKKQKKVRIGILGLGVVGSGLVTLIRKNTTRIAAETGVILEIEKIFVRDMSKKRDVKTSLLPLTTSMEDVIQNPDIDIICECMGGNGHVLTGNAVLQAMRNGKHIIMSSKKALALYAEPMVRKSREYNVHFKYDATVGGGIPIAKVLGQTFQGEKVTGITGIFNATSNYIYSEMNSRNLSFADALKEAQDKGYAENDPSDDIDGLDAMNKLMILSFFGMKKIIAPGSLKAISFTQTSRKDVQLAHELGYTIKPVASIHVQKDAYRYFVGPCLVPSDNIIANTSRNYNIICLKGEHCGELGFYGQGAGAQPTASAMFDDLINILTEDTPLVTFPFSAIKDVQLKSSASRYYLRFCTNNAVETIEVMTSVFSENEMDIERLVQKGEPDENVELLYFIHDKNALGMDKVLMDLGQHGIKHETMMGVL